MMRAESPSMSSGVTSSSSRPDPSPDGVPEPSADAALTQGLAEQGLPVRVVGAGVEAEGWILIERTGAVLAFNTQAAFHFGIPAPARVEHGRLPGCEWVRADGTPLPPHESPLARALAGEQVDASVWEVLRPDGTRALLRATAVPVKGGDGQVAAALLRTHGVEALPGAVLDASRLLAEAGALLGEAVDAEAQLEPLLKLLVPALGDGALLILKAPGEPVRVVASLHADAGRHALLRDLLGRYPPDSSLSGELPEVFVSGAVGRLPILSEEHVAAIARDAEHARLLREVGPHGCLSVPLGARGGMLGALMLLRSNVLRAFDADEERFLSELAHRTALYLENARLLREAREAVRQRDEFLGIASHELKTPLTPLSLKVQLLQKQVVVLAREGRPVPTEKVAETLDVVQRQVRRLSGLVDNLLDVSRITAGRLRLELEELDLASVAAEILYRFAPAAAQHGTELELNAPVPVVGRWDRLRLEQVVTNLVSNALKYGAGHPVVLGVEGHGTLARLTVKDHGIGIAPEDLARIFERFERAVSDRHYGGLGLGLYITRQIVEAFGGKVRATSEPGQGSTFILELPRGDIPEEWLTAHAAPGPTADLEPAPEPEPS
ncbi:HAMP domain-containing sensor histidine kinase [Corallococcus sp. BB11-1]|uniref:sensor histidine kinase n=1 Tax=Corallococcus sp. BB11-1 TaxID=2996783 RepID=UPI00226E0BBC|nr:HAMP domain-containing sensor histidine kinase [Corallococcus sp. BB11-1]MCY1036766.1 HAMP domain-containing sensor histidine kinase [Corallococcus sp. BB11-1]